MIVTEGHWLVQVGKGKGSYTTRYTFINTHGLQAAKYYAALLTHSGHKKRLVRPDGKVAQRYIS